MLYPRKLKNWYLERAKTPRLNVAPNASFLTFLGISATILTKNNEAMIADVLQALSWVDEIVVLDTGSTDNTLQIVKRFPNVAIHHSPFIGFGPLHNHASSLAKHDWILSIDSDEIASEALQKELQQLSLNSDCIYSVSRHNFFNGKWIKGCGWYPDRCVRLYHRGMTQFTDDQVHEKVMHHHLREVPLRSPLNHFSYRSIHDFLDKMQKYSDLFAAQNQHRQQSSLAKALSHGFFSFFKCYFLKRGFMDGAEGFIISSYNALTAYYKYLKLREYNSNHLE